MQILISNMVLGRRQFPYSCIDSLIDLHWAEALTVPMHLCLMALCAP